MKPGNILRGVRDGADAWFLIDLGVATSNTVTQLAGHTRGFAPPEVWKYLHRPDIVTLAERYADWWALGVTILTLICGNNPLENAVGGKFSRDRRLADSSKRHPDVHQRWWSLLAGLLTPSPGARWGAEHVMRFLNGETVPIHPDTPPIALPFDGRLSFSVAQLAARLAEAPEPALALLRSPEADLPELLFVQGLRRSAHAVQRLLDEADSLPDAVLHHRLI